MDRALLEKILQKTDSVLPIPLVKSASPKALVIDLSAQTSTAVDISQTFLNKYVGGPALAARLWACFVGSDIDSPGNREADNPIVVTGSSTGSLITIAFCSPVTGNLTFNTVSGKLNTGFCAFILIGRLSKPGVVRVSGKYAEFELDGNLCGLTATKLNELYPGSVATGPAAEKRVSYASAVCNNCITGRGGLGCVMAEKNVKAVDVGILPTAKDTFDFSTFIRNASIMGWAPVDNLSKRTDPRLFHLSNSEKTRKLGIVDISCQAILMLGSNIGCYDISYVYERYRFCLEKGLDPVSIGNVLGWIREAQERGIIAFSDPVDFSNNNHVMLLMEAIAERRDFADVFANGTKAAALYYGNTKYSKEINGLECGPYDYRGTVASAISDAMGNWFPVYFDLIPDLIIKDKVSLCTFNEELVMGLQCLNKNPDVVVPLIINKLKKIKKILVSKNLIGFDRVIKTDELNIGDVFTAGQNCRSIVRAVNSVLRNNGNYIPDFFCVDPESNASDEVIVDIRHLLISYKNNLQMSLKK